MASSARSIPAELLRQFLRQRRITWHERAVYGYNQWGWNQWGFEFSIVIPLEEPGILHGAVEQWPSLDSPAREDSTHSGWPLNDAEAQSSSQREDGRVPTAEHDFTAELWPAAPGSAERWLADGSTLSSRSPPCSAAPGSAERWLADGLTLSSQSPQ